MSDQRKRIVRMVMVGGRLALQDKETKLCLSGNLRFEVPAEPQPIHQIPGNSNLYRCDFLEDLIGYVNSKDNLELESREVIPVI